MALPSTIQDRDFNNFVEISGVPHRRVTGTIDVVLGSLLDGVQFDTILASYPTVSSEVYTYQLSAVTQAIVTVTYTDATKEVLTSVVRT